MSNWTDKRHEAARARCEAATEGPWKAQPDRTGTAIIVLDQEGDALWDAVGMLLDEDGEFSAHARTDLEEALDEIERLRAESARRMVWLETEQRSHEQTHAALVDMTERLRALTTITDDKVKRAASAAYENLATQDPQWNEVHGDTEFATLDGSFHFLETMHAALEATLNPPT